MRLTVDDPYSGKPYAEVGLLDVAAAEAVVARAAAAQREWARVPISQRIALCQRFADAFAAETERIARDITGQMGKPLAHAKREVATCLDRARYMVSIASSSLADEEMPAIDGFHRKVSHEPLGVVLDIAAWNYPLLIAVNVVVPAVLAGNSVLIKHASRTPLCGNHFADAFARAGALKDLVVAVHADHRVSEAVIARPEVGYVSFTGSVRGGHEIVRNASSRFIDTGLELGGKDPAYVAADADFDHAVENLVDGAFYNAGQSCCGVKRIYVHGSLYDRFLDAAVALAKGYRLGDPMDPATTTGPLAQPDEPGHLQRQAEQAAASGARILCGGRATKIDGKGRFFEPCIVADAVPGMDVIQEESFGPLVAVARVKDDEEAVRLMNDSRFGLTASIWTRDEERAHRLGREVVTGTLYMNRCDYLDPALPWVGVKDSGRGCSLSRWGFLHLTRPKSWHFRVKTA
jgi:acyl-CoA reductase-like NAD-dependent aldehyde dehydrogenase